jgi:transposase
MNNNIIFPGLEDLEILKVEEIEDRLAMFIELEYEHILATCPRYSAKTRQFHDCRVQKIKQLKWFKKSGACPPLR